MSKEEIQINNPRGEGNITVLRADYVRLKVRDLREFGYNVTADEVDRQITAALAGEPLSVIGLFIKGDLA